MALLEIESLEVEFPIGGRVLRAAEDVAAELVRGGFEAIAVRTDVADLASTTAMAQRAVEAFAAMRRRSARSSSSKSRSFFIPPWRRTSFPPPTAPRPGWPWWMAIFPSGVPAAKAGRRP